MKKVVIFRNDLLARSETFIKEQAQSLSTWKPVLVCYRRVKGGLDLGELEIKVIPGAPAKSVGRHVLRLRQLLDRPHPLTVEILHGAGAELVHAHFGTDATDIWPSVRAAGLPMTVTLHGYDISIRREWWEAGHGGIHRRAYPRRLLKMAHDPAVHFIAVSGAVKQRAIEYGIPENKITISYIGVDTKRFKPGGLPIHERKNRILFVGRLVEKKAPLLLIRAFVEVRNRIQDAELVMIGEGPLLKEAKRLARALGAPVEFMGAQDSNVVLAELHLARVLCLPSITAENGDAEGFGLVILEAQASGVPVVTSAQGGAIEGLLHRRTGFAFKEGDTRAMVHGLLSFIDTSENPADASLAAAKFVQSNFDLRSCSIELERIYDRTSRQSSTRNDNLSCSRRGIASRTYRFR